MRLFGYCPNCKAEDTIAQIIIPNSYTSAVKCENCDMSWNEWFDLTYKEGEKGNKLIPVQVDRRKGRDGTEYGTQLFWPSSLNDIPYNRPIIRALNSALMTRFNLRVCMATEGGVSGVYKRKFLELRNNGDKIGLYTEIPRFPCEPLTEIYDFYETMLRTLFEEPLAVGDKKYRRGEILRLDTTKPESIYQSQDILLATLTKVKSKQFAAKVLKTEDRQLANPFANSYLTGLTNEEIVKFFVPPPIDRPKDGENNSNPKSSLS